MMTRLERLAIADEAVSVLRHDIRNKIASVRNAVFYIRKKCKDSAPFREDPRIATFLDLIDAELGGAEALLTSEKLPRLPPEEIPVSVDLGACVEEAARARGLEAAISDRSAIRANPEEIRMLADALLDHASEAVVERPPAVRTLVGERGPALEIEHEGFARFAGIDELASKAEGLALLSLRSARRLASRNGGVFSLRGPVLRVEFAGPAASGGAPA